MRLSFFVALVSALALLFYCAMGCTGVAHPTNPAAPSMVSSVTTTPVALKNVATGLDWLILLSIVGVGVGVGLYFLLPAHNLSFAIAAIAGGIEGSALIARVSLWFIPWLAGGLLLVAVSFFAYEVYANWGRIKAEAGKVLPL